jgi:GH15 family glucan-1,4-alpha-glucosidase
MPRLDLAPVGNCAVASLIDRHGRHVWFCFPRLDGDPVFNALVNGTAPDSGFMDVVAEGERHFDQSYLRNSAIFETNVRTANSEEFRIIDFAPRFRQFGRNFRPPMLVRRIEPVKGQPRITIRMRPTFNYGAAKPEVSIGSNHIRYIGEDLVLRLTADVGPSYILDEAPFLLTRPINLFVGSDESVPEEPSGLAIHFLHETQAYWEDWTRKLAIPFEWQAAVLRAAITLKLCSYEETGAIVAALTTSIPEAPDTGRNWDYRYCWLRDAYFTVTALNRLNTTRTMEDFVRFLLDNVVCEDADSLHPLYPITKRSSIVESESPALKGFRDMGPVRIGNAASCQRQNDAYGSVVLSSAQIFWDERIPTIGGIDLYRRLCPLGHAAEKNALRPDAGVWEYRGRSNVFTYSAAMCWAAVHRLEMIARKVGAAQEAQRWQKSAEGLREEILRHSVTDEGWISGAFDKKIVDASVLLLPELGLLSSKDERFRKTLEIVEKRLLRGEFVLRYNEADDFGTPETAFIVCTFWYINALAAAGQTEKAHDLFVNLLSRRNNAGLLSEDIDPKTGSLWGNFPQTYSLVGLTLSAHRLSRTWEQGLWHVS